MVMLQQQGDASVLHTSIAHVARPSASNAHVHTQYVVRVSDERTAGLHWTVYRRYSEFRVFRRRLDDAVKRGDMCAHCAIMSKRTCFMQFPHRRLFWNTREAVLESRRVGLNAFLDAVAKHARTCRESMTCQTRTLMDQFLDVNDMRYTYLNVNMSDDEDFRGKLFLHSTGSTSSTSSNFLFAPTPTHLVPMPATRKDDSKSGDDDGAGDAASNQADDKQTPDDDATTAVNSNNNNGSNNNGSCDEGNVDGRILTLRHHSLPNLLHYNRDSRSSRASRGSFNDEAAAAAPVARLSDWESAKYQTSSAGRHSDPGTGRNDLLGFAGGRRSEQRNRSRRVHLSSAAKRVKKLEEQEARFSRPPSKQKNVSVLTPIAECDDCDDD